MRGPSRGFDRDGIVIILLRKVQKHPKTVESVLSVTIRNHGYQDILEEVKWENVKNVEQLFHHLRRSGQWPGARARTLT